MQIKKIDGALFKAMVANGAENLKLHYKEVDALNVFPVPDGDTGTNMKLTIDGGVNEIYALNETNLHEVAKKTVAGNADGSPGKLGRHLVTIIPRPEQGL